MQQRWILLLLIVPLMLAQLTSGSDFLIDIWSKGFIIASVLFLAYWTYVGYNFAQLQINKGLAFLLGNSLTIVLSLTLVLGAFTEIQPWLPLWNAAHFYPLFAIPLSTQLTEAIGQSHPSLFSVLMLANSMVVGAFSLGFMWFLRRQRG